MRANVLKMIRCRLLPSLFRPAPAQPFQPAARLPPARSGVLRKREYSLRVLTVKVVVAPGRCAAALRPNSLRRRTDSGDTYSQVLVEHDGRPCRARREPRRVEVGAGRREAVGVLTPRTQPLQHAAIIHIYTLHVQCRACRSSLICKRFSACRVWSRRHESGTRLALTYTHSH
jgi:hypothetical protein